MGVKNNDAAAGVAGKSGFLPKIGGVKVKVKGIIWGGGREKSPELSHRKAFRAAGDLWGFLKHFQRFPECLKLCFLLAKIPLGKDFLGE